VPFAMTDKDMARGRERFNIFCSPCTRNLEMATDDRAARIQEASVVL